MAKSQLNSMSKKEILQSIMYEQNQSNATLSRLITAVARTAGVDADKLAEMFVDDKGNQDFIETFNLGVKAKHAANHVNEGVPTDTDAAALAGDPSTEVSPEEVA